MNPREDNRYTLPLYFFVTAASFFLFSLLVKLLDGSASHVSLFIKIGIGALVLTLITFIAKSATASEE